MSSAGRERFEYEPEHRFTIRPDPHYGIMAGRSKDAQWLLSDQQQGVLAVKFDDVGNVAGSVMLEGEQPKQRRERLERWKAEVGFADGPIHVRKFFLDPYQIGVAALPSGMQEAVDDPESFDEEELGMVLEDAKGWLKDGQYVLKWGNEYYMSKDGEVVSS